MRPAQPPVPVLPLLQGQALRREQQLQRGQQSVSARPVLLLQVLRRERQPALKRALQQEFQPVLPLERQSAELEFSELQWQARKEELEPVQVSQQEQKLAEWESLTTEWRPVRPIAVARLLALAKQSGQRSEQQQVQAWQSESQLARQVLEQEEALPRERPQAPKPARMLRPIVSGFAHWRVRCRPHCMPDNSPARAFCR